MKHEKKIRPEVEVHPCGEFREDLNELKAVFKPGTDTHFEVGDYVRHLIDMRPQVEFIKIWIER